MIDLAYAVGSLVLAGGCLAVAYRLALSEPVRGAASRVLLVAVAAGLVLAVIFPEGPGPGTEIHPWATALVVTGLPCAAWMLARGRAPHMLWWVLRAASVSAVLLLAVMLAARPGSVLSDLLVGTAPMDLLERALVVVELVLVPLMAFAVFRPPAQPAPENHHDTRPLNSLARPSLHGFDQQ
ncbi:DUF998 domain-containing protein [Sinosporangium siamense]|uniref:DUF998 domain-containing protein n=1 Tax=Sinosporangium siamense TaxID=1367973 RepID=A0A919RD62_9ACTN|nr:DUF998 domain-containing protein [Sinosporangium siamense]GII91463.1 hypothetical protein Ssi02_16940 [Sinosporangium siamense]